MPTDIRQIVTNHQKQVLRRTKKVSLPIKAAVYAGCKHPGAANQFNYDLKTYGLWEAIIYIQNGEPKYYEEGTAEKVLAIALRNIPADAIQVS